MLYKTLSILTRSLNDYLKLVFKLTEDLAFLCPLKEAGNAFPGNRISISLINTERESAGGIRFNYQHTGDSRARKTAPAWQLNIYVLLSAVFPEKQYEESLQVFSGVLSFLQKNSLFTIQESGVSFAVEPVNVSFHELSNIWGVCGGNYYPSILCKIRVLSIDENEILDIIPTVTTPETTTKS